MSLARLALTACTLGLVASAWTAGVPRKSPELFSMESADALCQPKSRRRPDGPGAAHHHVANGAGGLAEIARGEDAEFMRKQPLLDEEDRVSSRVE